MKILLDSFRILAVAFVLAVVIESVSEGSIASFINPAYFLGIIIVLGIFYLFSKR